MSEPYFDHIPFVAVKDALHECARGLDKIALDLQRAVAKSRTDKPILVVECYPGVEERTVLKEIESRLGPKLTIQASEAYHSPERIDQLIAPYIRQENRGGGHVQHLSLVNFFNAEPLWRFRRTVDELKSGLVLIVGCGASLIAWGNILVYASLARREARQRLRQADNDMFGGESSLLAANLETQRTFLVDSSVADRWKRPLIKRWDYLLDTHDPSEPQMAAGPDVLGGLHSVARRPFRLPMFSDSAAGKTSGMASLEEHSLLLGFGDVRIEIPAIDLIFSQPHALLGETVYLRCGDEFPIRFDFPHNINCFATLGTGDGWREERATSLEQRTIELRRHRFSKSVTHYTREGVNVLNLIEGEEAIIESPDGAFDPLIIHRAETALVPAAVGLYIVSPNGRSAGKEITTMKAFVKMPNPKRNRGSRHETW